MNICLKGRSGSRWYAARAKGQNKRTEQTAGTEVQPERNEKEPAVFIDKTIGGRLMNILLCVAILSGVTALAAHYRPKKGEGRALCGLSVLQAAVVLLGGGGSPAYLLLQAFFAAVVLGCGLIALHRERVRAAARARRRTAAAGRVCAKAPARLGKANPHSEFCA